MIPPTVPAVPAPMTAPFLVRLQSAQPVVTAKNERTNKTTRNFFVMDHPPYADVEKYVLLNYSKSSTEDSNCQRRREMGLVLIYKFMNL
jgi:hypothetical protein